MYKLTNTAVIIRTSDGVGIFPDLECVDYIQYLDWLSGGNTPLPADAPTPASKDQRISTELQKVGCFNEEHLKKDIFVAEAFAQLEGKTSDQAYASNVVYRMLIDAQNAIANIKAEA